jgi:hypothetical protein
MDIKNCTVTPFRLRSVKNHTVIISSQRSDAETIEHVHKSGQLVKHMSIAWTPQVAALKI